MRYTCTRPPSSIRPSTRPPPFPSLSSSTQASSTKDQPSTPLSPRNSTSSSNPSHRPKLQSQHLIPHTNGPHFSFALLLLNRSSPPYLNLTTPGLTSEPPSLPSAHPPQTSLPPPEISPSNLLTGYCGFTSGECEDAIVPRERQDAGLGPRAGGGVCRLPLGHELRGRDEPANILHRERD